MKKKASGFYADSLEMLLDTMCNMLGAIVFIALMTALMAQDTPAPPPSFYEAQTAQLSNDLASVTASNSLAEADLQKVLLRLQDPHLRPATNLMRLPAASNTTKLRWPVIIRYDKLYPVNVLSTNGRIAVAPNNRTLSRQGLFVEPRPGMGDAPEQGVTEMARAFQASGKTNFFFTFYVYDDSFEAFMRAREKATQLGWQYGWDPLPENERLQLGTQGETILPQN
jgi:hypothetical protein